ncbi:putative disease resistance protein RGA3 [Citrus clementina]|uniref:putative disease resistance protein RGA3 n=1 Tax=Citrus clementina TaxID=85681 RepID=UPI000CED1534|nr:putative disease resistance protein RGA3 [Citrus x clementina]
MLFIDIKDNDEPKVINHKYIITKPPSFSHYDLILNELLLGNIISNHALDEWITGRRKLQIEGGIGENALIAPHKKKKIKENNEELRNIATQRDMFKSESGSKSSERPRRVQSTSLIDEEEICGRVGERNELLSKLLCESSEQQKGLHIISIVGMGGIGKTTLAQLACNHVEVKRKFDKLLWVCVSDPCEQFRIAKAIAEALGIPSSNLGEFQSLLKLISESITGKRFLLVLDDVWDGDCIKWEPFYLCLKNGLHGSKILVTTRKKSVASMMGSTDTDIITVMELAEEECCSLFKRLAFFGPSINDCEKLEQIGRRIAGKFKGLPLAAKTIGSLMRSKQIEEEWERILNSDLWRVEEMEKGVLSSLLLSYNDLPSKNIRKLPETLCELYNLEKLYITRCLYLEELPEGIGKLINMKHLLNYRTDSLRYMPVGIGRLTGLRTWDEFHVIGGGGVDGRKACWFESLKNLKHLQVCGIRRMGDVSDVGEAKRLELDKKKYLSCLRLWFDKKEEGGERRKNEDDQLLLEALRPPLDLKELQIRCLLWENCRPSFEKLSLLHMRSVKRVGDECLGIESDHRGSSSSSLVIIAFPKLKSLTISTIMELEEWDYGITRTGNTVINIMPRLSSLEIVACPNLKALPDHIHQTTTLKELRIVHCGLLEERYRTGEGEDWPKISHIPNLEIWP